MLRRIFIGKHGNFVPAANGVIAFLRNMISCGTSIDNNGLYICLSARRILGALPVFPMTDRHS